MKKIVAIIENYRKLYEEAKAAAPKNPDGSVSEDNAILHLKYIINFNEDAERERKAKHIISVLCNGMPDENTGQLCFPDFGSKAWQPLRLIRSEEGDLIENNRSVLKFKVADCQRSERHNEDTAASCKWKRREVDIFTTWTIEKIQAGEKPEDLTWGRCVEDLGLLDSLGEHAA